MAFVDRMDAEVLRVGPFENENGYNLATINGMRMHNVKMRRDDRIICNLVRLMTVWVQKKADNVKTCTTGRYIWLQLILHFSAL